MNGAVHLPPLTTCTTWAQDFRPIRRTSMVLRWCFQDGIGKSCLHSRPWFFFTSALQVHCIARQATSSLQVNVHLKHLQLTPTEVSAASNASRSKQVRSNEQAAGPFLGGFNWVTGKLAIWEDSGARIFKTVAWLLLCILQTFPCLYFCILHYSDLHSFRTAPLPAERI